MIIRPYTTIDKQECMNAFCSNVPEFFTESEVNDFDTFLDTFHTKGTVNKTYYFVLELDSKIIACGGFGDRYGDDVITLAWGLVHKDFHKKDFGKHLLKYRLDQIKLIYPGRPIYIDTTQFSMGFFGKYGFNTIKLSENFYAPGMHRYDMVYNENTHS
ncbi:MAG: hypothetical protein CFE21_03165 [Bacteroidetes bacterium B1(2017)]|nr:MAG: hypothetical protein CFE21_03165 [Bacteroidetes bacterium B1(2017)]